MLGAFEKGVIQKESILGNTLFRFIKFLQES